MSLRIERLTDPRELLGLEEKWSELSRVAGADPLFSRPGWVRPWWEIFGRSGDGLAVTALYEGPQLIGLAPYYLTREKHRGLPAKVLAPLARTTAERLDLLYPADRPELAGRLISAILEQSGFDLLLLPRIDSRSPTLAVAREAIERLSGSHLETPELQCPVVDIETNFEEYYRGRFKHKFRYNIRSRTKKLAKEGELTFQLFTGGPELEKLLGAVAEVEARSWKGHEGLGIFGREESREYYFRIARELAEEGHLALHLLWLDDRPISYYFGFILNNRYYDYSQSFDLEYRKYAPGVMALADLMETCFDRGLETFDFLRGDEDYKFNWATRTTTNINLHLFPKSLGGKGLELLKRAESRAREAKRMIKGRLQSES